VPIPDNLAALFAELRLAPPLVEHPALRTVADAHAYWDHLPGLAVKNLFLKDAGGQHWLVVLPAEVSTDIKALAGLIGSRRLSFGSALDLIGILGVEPGAVTPLAMMNDSRRQVRLVLHAAIETAPAVLVHPLVNTATLMMLPADLRRFLDHCGAEPAIVDLTPAFRQA
jgi:Ala-tRNA(Pro) deacylase